MREERGIERVKLHLELLGGLVRMGTIIDGKSQWPVEKWIKTLRFLSPRDARVVVLHLLHDLTFESIGQKLGTTRQRTDQLYRRALRILSFYLRDEFLTEEYYGPTELCKAIRRNAVPMP